MGLSENNRAAATPSRTAAQDLLDLAGRLTRQAAELSCGATETTYALGEVERMAAILRQILAETAQQHAPAAGSGLGDADHGIQPHALDPLLLVRGGAGLDAMPRE